MNHKKSKNTEGGYQKRYKTKEKEKTSWNNVLPPMRCETQTQGSTAAHGREYNRWA